MSVATTFNFDSVGDSLPTLREHEKIAFEAKKINYSPKTPLKLSSVKTEMFVMNKKLADGLSDNLKNLILTNRGERVMQPDFGANLKGILGEFGTDGFETEVMTRIKSSVQKYLPYVKLTTFQMDKVDLPPETGLTSIIFTIGFAIPAANIQGKNISVTMNTIA